MANTVTRASVLEQPGPDAVRTTLPLERASWWARLTDQLGWNGAILLEIAIILIVWEIAVRGLGLFNPRFVPPPSDIGTDLIGIITDGSLARNLGYSIQNFAVGYTLAAALGAGIGFVLGTSAKFRAAALPFLWAMYATPRGAIQPLLVLWIGFGTGPKILIIFLMAFFPIAITVYEGVRDVDPTIMRAARVFGVRGFDMYRKILLPSSLPFVLTALRIGVSRATVGIVVGEFIGGNQGLGFAIQQAGQLFLLSKSLAITVVLVAIANVTMLILLLLRRRLAPWHADPGA